MAYDVIYVPRVQDEVVVASFETLEEAKRFAQINNYNYKVIEPLKRKIIKKSYAQNFIKKSENG